MKEEKKTCNIFRFTSETAQLTNYWNFQIIRAAFGFLMDTAPAGRFQKVAPIKLEEIHASCNFWKKCSRVHTRYPHFQKMSSYNIHTHNECKYFCSTVGFKFSFSSVRIILMRRAHLLLAQSFLKWSHFIFWKCGHLDTGPRKTCKQKVQFHPEHHISPQMESSVMSANLELKLSTMNKLYWN